MSVWVDRSTSTPDFPLEPVHGAAPSLRPTLHKRQVSVGVPSRVLERFVAGVVVIGLLLWGASILATPDEVDESAEPPGTIAPEPTLTDVNSPPAQTGGDAGPDPSSTDRKGKNKGPG